MKQKERQQQLGQEEEPYLAADPGTTLSLREAFEQLSDQERMIVALFRIRRISQRRNRGANGTSRTNSTLQDEQSLSEKSGGF